MKQHMTESRMQGWRALAIGKDGSEHLIFVGMSYEQVKKNYQAAFLNVLTDDEQDNIDRIQMQRWSGVPDSGKWISQDTARLPVKKVNTQIIEDDDDDDEDLGAVDAPELQAV